MIKTILQLSLLISFPFLLLSQNKLPIGTIKNHLKRCAEISDTSENIFIKKMCGNDTVAIYWFGSRQVHKYWFLLLKDTNHYTILNCNKFTQEWEALDKVLTKLNPDANYTYLSQILWQYKLNQDYHPSPPFGNLKKLKNSNGKLLKPTYLPRKVYETKPFNFVQPN